ncbi:hypothetical protein H5410_046389 [Solanum commersonii]|uniref:cellulase n=1 Tax=Solanum commersonii TaxID=4109 RepID=A0A9J5XC47_SOLCO|nr:hypothetical protein H5410_046389 [Solanum commersonii]
MASSTKTPALDKPNPAEDWTVKINSHKVIIHERQKQEQLWTPVDIETNPEKESKLMQKIQTCITKLESSSFWLTFLDQLQTPKIFDRFLKVVGSEGKMQMVICGIGSIESYEPPRLQLSFAILMKGMFSWIGEVENLLERNWRHDLLSNMTLFGNSFEAYEQHVSKCKNLRLADSRKHILAIRQFVKQFPIDSRKHIAAIKQFVIERSIDPFSVDLFRAFHGSNLPNSPGKELYYSRSAKQSRQFFMSSKVGHNAPDDRNIQKNPRGLIYRQRWNNMYFVTSDAFLATTYSDYLASAGKYLKCSSGFVSLNELLSFFQSQVDYILGDNLRATK